MRVLDRVRLYGRVVELFGIRQLPLDHDPTLPQPDLVVERVRVLPPGLIEVDLPGAIRVGFAKGFAAVVIPAAIGPLEVEHIVIDHVVPMGLSMSGDLLVHAAGLASGSRGLLLCGESGAGKSTTSAFFAASGWRPLGDDAIRLELDGPQVRMWPSYEGFRLHQDTLGSVLTGIEATGDVAEASLKRRALGIGTYSSDSALLTSLLVLGPASDEVMIRALGPAQRAAVIARSAFHPGRSALQAAESLDQAGAIAERLDGWTLEYQRTRASLHELFELFGSGSPQLGPATPRGDAG